MQLENQAKYYKTVSYKFHRFSRTSFSDAGLIRRVHLSRHVRASMSVNRITVDFTNTELLVSGVVIPIDVVDRDQVYGALRTTSSREESQIQHPSNLQHSVFGDPCSRADSRAPSERVEDFLPKLVNTDPQSWLASIVGTRSLPFRIAFVESNMLSISLSVALNSPTIHVLYSFQHESISPRIGSTSS